MGLAFRRMGTQAITIWNGQTRATPADLRGVAYDVPSAAHPRQKLLVCAAPRTSSKRLARLLLGAGLGVPMEYFNPNAVGALTARWGITKRDYLRRLYASRTVNGIFAATLQHHQLEAWPYREHIDDLFDGATVVHLIRPDKRAQAVSLAACLLTGQWGFEEPAACPEYSRREMKRAARQAMAFIATEDEQ